MKYKYFYFHLFSKLFILLQTKFILSQVLNKIIKLADEPYRYTHFSFTSEGDMIIDTSAFPDRDGRKIYGLKKNNKYYFKDEHNKDTPYLDLKIERTTNPGRIEGESIIVKLEGDSNGKECLIGISKEADYQGYYVEIYDLDTKTIKYELTNNIFGHIASIIFSALKFPDDIDSPNYDYIFSYITKTYYFEVMKVSFNLVNTNFYDKSSLISIPNANINMVSCFFTEKKKYICFYQNKNSNYVIIVFDNCFINYSKTEISCSHFDNVMFLKGIHLKKEIGAYIYYKSTSTSYPTFTLKECNSDNEMVDYNSFGEIELNKILCNKETLFNDLIKINDNKTCFVSPNNDNKKLYIVIFNLYNNDLEMTIRYYIIETYKNNNFLFFQEVKAALFNNFICIAFSVCSRSTCGGVYSEDHYSSFFI